MAKLHVCHLAEATRKPRSATKGRTPARARFALSLIRDGDRRFETRPPARAAGDVLGDLFGERGGVGAVVEPDSLLDGDPGSIGEPDTHASLF